MVGYWFWLVRTLRLCFCFDLCVLFAAAVVALLPGVVQKEG